MKKRAAHVWGPIRRLVEALEGIDDPQGDYLLRLEKRMRALEAELEQLRDAAQQKKQADSTMPA
jgi:hypothetical protein